MDGMKAVVWSGPGQLALEDLPVPVPGEGEVLVRTGVVGICGTDFEIFDGRFNQAVPPMILGHEGAGTVESVGPGVRSPRPGERVSVECVIGCGRCDYCAEGRPGLCDEGRVMGVSGAQGEYAEYFVAPAGNCHRIPERISWAAAGLVDTLAGPAYAMSRMRLAAGASVAVFGPGPAGLFFCELARLQGARAVFLVGTRESRLAYGPRFGADRLIDANREDPVQAVRSATAGRGVDLAIEAAGSAVALRQCLAAARKGGSVLVYGVFGGGEVCLDVQPVQLFELQITGTANILYPRAIELIRDGAVAVETLVTHRLTLEELPAAFTDGALQRREDRYCGYMKGVVLL
jgi:2-desacetyl-2-hydroxyethyl bacteriochlorophyllide A dehydrogenase